MVPKRASQFGLRCWKTDLGRFLGAIWDPVWASSGPTSGHFGPRWSPLGAFLGPCRRANLGSLGGVFGLFESSLRPFVEYLPDGVDLFLHMGTYQSSCLWRERPSFLIAPCKLQEVIGKFARYRPTEFLTAMF